MEGKRSSEFWNSVCRLLGLLVTSASHHSSKILYDKEVGKLFSSGALLKVCQDYLVHPDLSTDHLTTRFPEKIRLCLSELHWGSSVLCSREHHECLTILLWQDLSHPPFPWEQVMTARCPGAPIQTCRPSPAEAPWGCRS